MNKIILCIDLGLRKTFFFVNDSSKIGDFIVSIIVCEEDVFILSESYGKSFSDYCNIEDHLNGVGVIIQ